MRYQEEKPASFIGKLSNILRSKEYAKIIYWDTQHKGIRVINQKRLEQIILPKYFRHNRFQSFVRQLNMYDFHKVHLQDHHSYFCHHDFDPKNKENMHLIRRKITFDNKMQSQQRITRPKEYQRDDKQNYSMASSFFKSSSKFLCKKSIRFLQNEKNTSENDIQQEILNEIIQILIEYKENKIEFDEKLKQLKQKPRYLRYLRKMGFLQILYTKLGIQIDNIQISLSQLSIQGELLIKTRKSLPAKSLKMLQSGNFIYRKETIRNFLNI